MVEENKGNLKYTARVYKPDGTLAQYPFIYESEEILSPGDVIDLPQGLYNGEYKIAAIGMRNCEEDLTEEEIKKSTIYSTTRFQDEFPQITMSKSKQFLINYEIADAEIIKASEEAFKHFPMGCSRGVKSAFNYHMYGDKIDGTRTNMFVYPAKYQEPIQDAYVSPSGWLLNWSPQIRKSLANKELVIDFLNRGYIKKGLANKFVDWVGKKLGKDPNTKGGRNLTKAVIAGGLVGLVLTIGGFYKASKPRNKIIKKAEQVESGFINPKNIGYENGDWNGNGKKEPTLFIDGKPYFILYESTKTKKPSLVNADDVIAGWTGYYP